MGCCTFLLSKPWLLGSIFGATTTVVIYKGYRFFTDEELETLDESLAKCAGNAEKDQVYETDKYVNEYLLMHFGEPSTLMPWNFGPRDALEFPKRCADLCKPDAEFSAPGKMRALDVGCAVGRASFELCAYYDEVVGIDFSHAFIRTANELKKTGRSNFKVLQEGDIYSQHEAVVDPSLDPSKATFEQGDACNLSADIGTFDCVLAANLICRLPNPGRFLDRMKTVVKHNGLLILTTPYTYMTEYTEKEQWLGGRRDAEGNELRGADVIDDRLSPEFELVKSVDMPFFIRETARKNQWTVADGRIYKRL